MQIQGEQENIVKLHTGDSEAVKPQRYPVMYINKERILGALKISTNTEKFVSLFTIKIYYLANSPSHN